MAQSAKRTAEATDYSMQEKILALYELQKVDSRIDEINKLKGQLPLEVQDLQDEVEGLGARIENLRQEEENLTLLTRQRKEEAENAKTLIARYEEQQNNVRNNREFDSLTKEIEFQRLEIELCDKRLKEYAAEAKVKRKQVEDAEALLADRQIDFQNKKQELETIDAETAAQIEVLEKQSVKAQEKIDARLLEAYRRIRQRNAHNGLAVVVVKRDACGGCFNRIPPQKQFDIRLNKKLIVCEYCGRILVSDEISE